MEYYNEILSKVRNHSSNSTLINKSAIHAFFEGSTEVEKHWVIQKEMFPYGSQIFFNYDSCKALLGESPEENWDYFKIGAVEKMKEISISSPADADTIIYCDSSYESPILLEVSKDLLFDIVNKKAPQKIIENFSLHNKTVFNSQIKLLNQRLLKLPIALYIERGHFLRHIIIEL